MIKIVCVCGQTLDPMSQDVLFEINLSLKCIFVRCKNCKAETKLNLQSENSSLPKMKILK